MENRKKEGMDWLTVASKIFCGAALFIFFYIFIKYALAALMPFVIAYIFSLIIDPVAAFLSKKTRIPKKLCAFVALSLIIILLGVLLCLGIRRLVGEVSALMESASRGEGGLVKLFDLVGEALEKLREKFGFAEKLSEGSFGRISEDALCSLSDAGEKLISSFIEGVGGFLKRIISATPSFLIGVAVTVLSSYYFCVDKENVNMGFKKLMPSKYRADILGFLQKLKGAAKKYAKAYLILMSLTFVEIFVGLLILKVRYAFLIALGISVVDILPVLGAGIVLVPWAVCALLLGDMHVGLGLLVLYGVVTIIRQIAEPRVIGSSMGIHPAAALFSSYVGIKLFGFLGIILGPAAAFMISEIINERRARN